MSRTFVIHKFTSHRHLHCLLAKMSVFDNFRAKSKAVPLPCVPTITDRSTWDSCLNDNTFVSLFCFHDIGLWHDLVFPSPMLERNSATPNHGNDTIAFGEKAKGISFRPLLKFTRWESQPFCPKCSTIRRPCSNECPKMVIGRVPGSK